METHGGVQNGRSVHFCRLADDLIRLLLKLRANREKTVSNANLLQTVESSFWGFF